MTTESQLGQPNPASGWQPQQPQQPVAFPAPGHPQPGFPGQAPQPGSVPGIGPVIGFTAVFGVFGAISASRRAARAQAAGVSGQKYWVAFGGTLAAGFVLWGGVTLAALSVPGAVTVTMQPAPAAVASAATITDVVAPGDTPELLNGDWLEESIVSNSNFKTDEGVDAEVTSATCSAGQVDAGGAGVYHCVIDFATGSRQVSEVTVDSSGSWVTSA